MRRSVKVYLSPGLAGYVLNVGVTRPRIEIDERGLTRKAFPLREAARRFLLPDGLIRQIKQETRYDEDLGAVPYDLIPQPIGETRITALRLYLARRRKITAHRNYIVFKMSGDFPKTTPEPATLPLFPEFAKTEAT